MSLDVYLVGAGSRPAGSGIFIREDGETREISRADWDARFPDREPVVADYQTEEVYSRNITHNLGAMAEAAGIYRHLWRPDEIEIFQAAQLVAPLSAGLAALTEDPDRFRALNPSNGWGTYEGLVTFVADYLAACCANPQATVKVSR